MVTETLQVTVLFKRRRMRSHGMSFKFHSIVWIFLLQQVTKSSPASIQIPERYISLENGTRHGELSDIVEYTPSDFPAEAAKVSLNMKDETSNSRIATFNVKTFLHVENGQRVSQPSSTERQRKDLVAKFTDGVSNARDGNASLGLPLSKFDGWNRRSFVRGKVEPNQTKYSLDDLDYVPGRIEHRVSLNLESIFNANVKDPDERKSSLSEAKTKAFGISLEDGGWKKKLYVRGAVERNETKASLSDIEYEPGEISINDPALWHSVFLDSNEELDESKEPGEEETQPKVDSSWETKSYDGSKLEASKSGRNEYDYASDKTSPDSSEQYWYGPGKIEKLYYNNGIKTWKEISGKQRIADKSPPRSGESFRRGRELSYSSSDNDASATSSDEVTESVEITYNSQDNHEHKIIAKDIRRSRVSKARQLVFHPYLPYGKDVPADEKIKFGDILPVRMVKFVKSMVEEAPWEQMFIKMVRMVVDQFVDKIIEKMFADKGGEHLKKRSIDSFLDESWGLPAFVSTHVVREKRAMNRVKPSRHDEDFFSVVPNNRDSQGTEDKGKKTEEERRTWLDHFLDYVFPNNKSMDDGDQHKERLTKRDTKNSHLFRFLVSYFLNYFEKTSEIITDAKDALRYKMIKDILPYLYQKRFLKPAVSDGSSNSVESIKMSPRDITDQVQNENEVPEDRYLRRRRSIGEDARKAEDGSRLWQESSRRHKPHHRRTRDDCSLRRACNAGRFLSRLPAVEEITLQLKSQGNEPHWEAMIWGMKKKRCSRIFCKRQRSPKGSRHSWNPDKHRPSRKLEIVTEPPSLMDELANLSR